MSSRARSGTAINTADRKDAASFALSTRLLSDRASALRRYVARQCYTNNPLPPLGRASGRHHTKSLPGAAYLLYAPVTCAMVETSSAS